MGIFSKKDVKNIEKKIEDVLSILNENIEKNKSKIQKLEEIEKLLDNVHIELKIKKQGYDDIEDVFSFSVEYLIKPTIFTVNLKNGEVKNDETFKSLSFLNLLTYKELTKVSEFIEKLKK